MLTTLLITAALLAGNADDPTTYYPLADDDTIDPVAQCLIDLGWTGHSDDHMAAIYAPTIVIRNCGGTPYPLRSV